MSLKLKGCFASASSVKGANTRTFESRGGGGLLPYINHIGMCGPKEYGF